MIFEGSLVIDRTAFGVGPAPSRWSLMSIDEVPSGSGSRSREGSA